MDSSVQIHLRDCTTMEYQNPDFCANCYQNVVDRHNNSARKFTDQLETFRDGRRCQYGVTVGQALRMLFDVIRKSHVSPIILDEDTYTLCQNCFNLLSQLYLFFEEFTNCSSPAAFLFRFIRSSRLFGAALSADVVKSEPPDEYMEYDYDEINALDNYHALDDNSTVDLFGDGGIDAKDIIVLNNSGNEDNQIDDEHMVQPKNWVEAAYCPAGEETGRLSKENLKKRRTRAGMTTKKIDYGDDDEDTVVKRGRKPRKRTHICTECHMGFTRSNHLRRHAILHSAKEFTCECGVGFRAKRNLEYHLKYNCPKNATFQKKSNHHVLSGLEKPQQSQLDKSAKIKQAAKLVRIAKKSQTVTSSKRTSRKNEPRTLVCSLKACGKVFGSNYKLGRHEAIHLVKPFICEHCHKSYRTEDILSNHIRLNCRVFNNLDLPQSAKEATTTTTTINEKEIEGTADENGEKSTTELMKRPSQRKPSNNEKRYTCHCGASFSRTNHLHDHSLVHREANVVCGHCDAGFISQEKLDKHEKVVHDPNYKKPTNAQRKQALNSTGKVVSVKIKKKVRDSNSKEDCKVCGKSIRARNMRIHLSTHSEIRPAVCELCGLSFKLYWSLKCHQKYAHGDHRPFLCRFCGVAFKRNQHLVDHEVVKHSDVRRYVCDEPGCDKTFKSSRNLRQHRHLHAGVKFPCPECGKVFSRKDNLKVHRDKSCRPVSVEGAVQRDEINDCGLDVGFKGQTQPIIDTTTVASIDSDTSIVVDDHAVIQWSKREGERQYKQRQVLGFTHRFYDRPKPVENTYLNTLVTKFNSSSTVPSSSSSTKVIQNKGIYRQEHKTKASSTGQSISFHSQMASAAITASHFLYAQPPTNIVINNSTSQPSYLQTSSFLLPVPTSTSATNSICNTSASNSGLTNPIMFDLDNFGKL